MIYYVSPSGNDSNPGTAEQPWQNLRAAESRIDEGDTVLLLPGTYVGQWLKIDTPGTTWAAADDTDRPVISGGYGRELLNAQGKLSKPPTEFENGGIYKNWWWIDAPNVTAEGLLFRDIPGRALMVTAGDAAVLNCDFNWTYAEAINVAPTTVIRNIRIVNCDASYTSVMELDPSLAESMPYRPDPNTGAIRVSRADGVLVSGCTVEKCYGEGFNMGKGARNVIVEDCAAVDCAHKHLNQNHSVNVLFRRCRVEHTGDPEFWRGGHVGGGFGCNDENTGGNWPVGTNIRYENCVVIGTDNFFRIDNQWKQERLTGIEIVNCTFVANENTRTGALVQEGNGQQNQGVIENCIFDFTAAPDCKPASGNHTGGIEWRNNVWSKAPAKQYRGAGDVVADPLLLVYAPTAESAAVLDRASYTVTPPPDDYYEQPRGDAPDIGAVEYAPASPDPEPDPPLLDTVFDALMWGDEPYAVLPMPEAGRVAAIWLDAEAGVWRAAVLEGDTIQIVIGDAG